MMSRITIGDILNVDSILRASLAEGLPGERVHGPAGELEGRRPVGLAGILLSVVLLGGFYGAVMGTSGGLRDGRLLQILYSGIKVPMLLLVAFLVSLPSFFVLNTLLGVREDFGRVLRALLATQGVMTVVLASFAPITVLWYLSSTHYQGRIMFNAAIFGLASVSAQGVLRRLYRPLVRSNAAHLKLLRLWIVVYAFVGIQMAWVLRPFIGNPGRPVEFFREGAWGNAYVELWHIVRAVVGF